MNTAQKKFSSKISLVNVNKSARNLEILNFFAVIQRKGKTCFQDTVNQI